MTSLEGMSSVLEGMSSVLLFLKSVGAKQTFFFVYI